MAQLVKNQSATLETWLQSLGWEDPLEKAEQPTRLLPGESMDTAVHGVAELDTTGQLSAYTHTHTHTHTHTPIDANQQLYTQCLTVVLFVIAWN